MSGAFSGLQTCRVEGSSESALAASAAVPELKYPVISSNTHQSLGQAPSWLTPQQRRDRQSGLLLIANLPRRQHNSNDH